MEKDLGNYRKSYEKQELLEQHISQNPMDLFEKWFNEVDTEFDEGETNAMTLSTIGLDGFPKSRVVLLKKLTRVGFIFYTNYESEKGKAIANNKNVCLSFFWAKSERQVIIKGIAEKVDKSLSDSYFQSRPRGSQLGAVVSKQSEVLESREVLDKKLEHLKQDYVDKEIPRPEHWGGYLVRPIEMEFWQGRANRLHDRIRYQLKDSLDWQVNRLSP